MGRGSGLEGVLDDGKECGTAGGCKGLGVEHGAAQGGKRRSVADR
jgi:hypothetical protein